MSLPSTAVDHVDDASLAVIVSAPEPVDEVLDSRSASTFRMALAGTTWPRS